MPFNSISLSTDRRYLVKGLIPYPGLTVIWGPPKSGKSFWTLDLAMHVALGRKYRGKRVHRGR
jgi:RecA-family ATPase